ncbi:hypothetical protein CI109_107163 [Kwoniella shandongensis]|uniref:Uncharacterized protein n=1 Tax=Kwoniella shandongensis TaxID=1734106 RepID=A0A5M6C6L2_9TREE|nr:uncharacterized protein CI109_002446 [Kwoniella shandongensis]KAA5529105.1 hypothetical protein CI109_002446 [Kwoniella shandongensis]
MTDNANTNTAAPVSDTPAPSSAPDQIINPSASPSTQPAAVLPTPPAPIASTSAPTAATSSANAPDMTKGKTKKPSRRVKARPRRRVAGSDVESDGEAASQGSLTDASSASELDDDDDEEEDEDHEEVPSKKPGTSKFEDVTPVGWTEAVDKGQTAELTFDEFNRGEAGSVRGAGAKGARGRGRGRGGAAGPARELTEEERARIEENRKRKKEKIKAKRAELKEAKRKEKEEASKGVSALPTGAASEQKEEGKKGKGKGKKKLDGPVSAPYNLSEQRLISMISKSVATPAVTPLVEALVELTLQDPAVQPSSTDSSQDPPNGRPELTSTASSSSVLPNHARPPRGGNNRDAYTQRLATDPKFTPRVGGFWTHDQRLYDSGPVGEGAYTGLRQMSDYWRGRGAPRGARGGFRGRGRGFGPGPAGAPFAGRQPPPPPPSEPKPELTVETEEEKGDEPLLEMDRLERELAKKEQPTQVVPVAAPPREKKWGHEAFEAIQTESERKVVNGVLRGGIRGRARGRGGFVPRGGHFGQPFRPVELLTPQSTSGRTNVNIPSIPAPTKPVSLPVSAERPTQSAEEQSTQPDTDSLLGESGHAVTVKLPGSDKSVQVDGPSTAPSEVGTKEAPLIKTPEISSSGQAILYSSPVPPPAPPVMAQPPKSQTPDFVPSSRVPYLNGGPAAAPVFVPQSHPSPLAAGSDNGSISSAGQFPPASSGPAVYPDAGAEFYPSNRPEQNGQARQYYPNGGPRAYLAQQQAGYVQGSYNQYPTQHSNRVSFSGPAPQQYYGQSAPTAGVNGYVDGRGSPFNGSPNPYTMANGGQMGGYFAPARPSQKISIRAPAPGSQLAKGDGTPSYANVNSGYYPQHYNPYNAATGGAQMYNGGGEEGMYYPMANGVAGQGYGWDGQDGGAYGYEGDYGY